MFVPTDFGEVVSDELFIETLLRFTGGVDIRGPETGGVGCENFINHNQFSIALPELKFGIAEDNSGFLCVLAGGFEEIETHSNQLVC